MRAACIDSYWVRTTSSQKKPSHTNHIQDYTQIDTNRYHFDLAVRPNRPIAISVPSRAEADKTRANRVVQLSEWQQVSTSSVHEEVHVCSHAAGRCVRVYTYTSPIYIYIYTPLFKICTCTHMLTECRTRRHIHTCIPHVTFPQASFGVSPDDCLISGMRSSKATPPHMCLNNFPAAKQQKATVHEV